MNNKTAVIVLGYSKFAQTIHEEKKSGVRLLDHHHRACLV